MGGVGGPEWAVPGANLGARPHRQGLRRRLALPRPPAAAPGSRPRASAPRTQNALRRRDPNPARQRLRVGTTRPPSPFPTAQGVGTPEGRRQWSGEAEDVVFRGRGARGRWGRGPRRGGRHEGRGGVGAGVGPGRGTLGTTGPYSRLQDSPLPRTWSGYHRARVGRRGGHRPRQRGGQQSTPRPASGGVGGRNKVPPTPAGNARGLRGVPRKTRPTEGGHPRLRWTRLPQKSRVPPARRPLKVDSRVPVEARTEAHVVAGPWRRQGASPRDVYTLLIHFFMQDRRLNGLQSSFGSNTKSKYRWQFLTCLRIEKPTLPVVTKILETVPSRPFLYINFH